MRFMEVGVAGWFEPPTTSRCHAWAANAEAFNSSA